MSGLIGRRLGRYEVLSLLGAGGMGWVYRARDVSLGRDVAIKVLPDVAGAEDTRVERFNREIRTVARLSHPNIVEIYDYGWADGVSYAVMELLRGRNLREYMHGKPLPIERALDIGIAVANALGAAHREGILHRDVKPANIFITAAGDVKMLDFGLARCFDPGSTDPDAVTEEPTLTSPGTVVGTTGYMSPEQVRGQPLDARSDIFALGCVLYEMLGGASPFLRATRADTMSAVLAEQPPPLTELRPALAPALDLIVGRCLAKLSDDRFESARDVAFALQALSSGRSSRASGVQGVAADRGRRLLRALATVVGVLVIVVGGWALLRSTDRGLPAVGASRQLTAAPGWESDPAVSPDGSLVVYASNEGGASDLWIVDVVSLETLRLTDHTAADHSPSWFPDGSSLAFVSERGGQSGIWRVSRFGGLAVPLVEAGVDPAISPDGTRIAFATRSPAGLLRIAVALLSRPDGANVLTTDEDGFLDHRHPTWSPDGKRICYEDFRDLWMVSADGGRPRRLTGDQGRDRFPAWSGDGRFVFFSSARHGTQAIWRVAVDGGEPQRVTLGTGPEVHPSLSRDGRRIAYTTHREQLELRVLDRTIGRSVRMEGARTLSVPALSPDGRNVAYSLLAGGQYDLWLAPVPVEGGPVQPRRLTDHPATVATPTFSPDGRWIAWFGVLDGARDVWTLSLEGGAPHRFTEDPAADIHPAFSPDGRRLAFASDRSGGRYHLWVAPIENGLPAGEARAVTGGDAHDVFPAWSPDESRMAFIRAAGDDNEVWEVELESERARPVTRGAQAMFVRWDALEGGLLVSGLWGTGRVELRRVDESTGEATPFRPLIATENVEGAGAFSTSADGRFLATYETSFLGDIWFTDLDPGRGAPG